MQCMLYKLQSCLICKKVKVFCSNTVTMRINFVAIEFISYNMNRLAQDVIEKIKLSLPHLMIFCSHNAEIPDNCEKAADSSDAEYDDDFEEYDSSEVSKGTLYFYSILKFFFWKYNIFNIYFTLIFMQIKFWKVFLQWNLV